MIIIRYNDQLWPQLRHRLRDQVEGSVRQNVNRILKQGLWEDLPDHLRERVVIGVRKRFTGRK